MKLEKIEYLLHITGETTNVTPQWSAVSVNFSNRIVIYSNLPHW